MKFEIEIPDISSLEFIQIEVEPFLKGNNGVGKVWRKVNIKVPRGEGIYLLYNKEKELLYIGETNDILGRLSNHLSRMEGIFYTRFFETKMHKRRRLAVEQLLIDELNPKNQTNYDTQTTNLKGGKPYNDTK